MPRAPRRLDPMIADMLESVEQIDEHTVREVLLIDASKLFSMLTDEVMCRLL